MKIQEFLNQKPKCVWCKVLLLVFFILIFTGSDLIVKEVVTQNLKNKPEVTVIRGFWSFHYVVNDDIGFSILRWVSNFLNTHQKWIFLVILQGVGSLVVIGFYFYSNTVKLMIPLGLMVSGALGNVIDRIIRGYVVDYVMWYYKDFIWPIFNLADVYTVIGACLLFIVVFFFSKDLDLKEKSS